MSLNPYLKIYDENNLKNLNAQKNLIEENANKNIADLQAEGELAKKEAEASYEGLINTQNVQRLINEKKIAETMANLGLSDSGLNRTQQTAVQLSHSNAVAQLQLQRQKKVDEIARLVQQQVSAVKTQLSQDLMKTQSAYDQSKTQWAGEQYNAQLEAQQERLNSMNTAKTKLIEKITSEGITDQQKQMLVDNYIEMYPEDYSFTSWMLDNGWKAKEDANGNIYYQYSIAPQTNNVKSGTLYEDTDTGKVYHGVATSAADVGSKPNNAQISQLITAFNSGGLKSYWTVRNQLAAQEVSTVEMDKAMEDKYGVLWQIFTSQSTLYNSADNKVNVVKGGGLNLDGGVANQVVLDINGTEEKIKDLMTLGKEKGISESVLKNYLEIYGTNKAKGFENTEYGGLDAWNEGKTSAQTTKNTSDTWWEKFVNVYGKKVPETIEKLLDR